MSRILSILLLLLLSGCTFRSISHSPATAAEAANIFLRAVYIEHDYDRALNLADLELRKVLTVATLKEMVELAEKNCGALEELKAESYMSAQGMIHIFYVGKCDKATLYHLVVMNGDVKNGYRTAGVWFRDTPYPQQQTALKFEKPIVVR